MGLRKTLDPYGVLDNGSSRRNSIKLGVSVGRVPPEAVSGFISSDLPDAVREKFWARHHSQIDFPAGLEKLPGTAIEEADLPL